MTAHAFQDSIPDNYCWGCGPLNAEGLHIKSYWSGEHSVCSWQPGPQHMAGPRHILNGGVIATVIDCHCICTAIAAAYQAEGRPSGSEPRIWYATAALNIKYLKPALIDRPVTLHARITDTTAKKTMLACTLSSNGETCAEAEVVAVRVPTEWLEDSPLPEDR